MKKLLITLLVLFCLTGCDSSMKQEDIKYTVDFVVSGEVVTSKEVSKNSIIDLKYLNKLEIDNVSYWYILDNDKEVKIESITIIENTTIYACLLEDKKVSVNYNFNDEKFNYTEEHFINSTIDLVNYDFKDDDYKFLYWYTLEDGKEVKLTSLTIITNIDIYAKYSKTVTLPLV